MLLNETHSHVMFQVVARIQAARGTAAAWFGYGYSFFFAIGPRIEAAVLNNRLQVFAVGEVIQAVDMMAVDNLFICFPIIFCVIAVMYFRRTNSVAGSRLGGCWCRSGYIFKRVQPFGVCFYQIGMREGLAAVVHIAAGVVIQQHNRFCLACLS